MNSRWYFVCTVLFVSIAVIGINGAAGKNEDRKAEMPLQDRVELLELLEGWHITHRDLSLEDGDTVEIITDENGKVKVNAAMIVFERQEESVALAVRKLHPQSEKLVVCVAIPAKKNVLRVLVEMPSWKLDLAYSLFPESIEKNVDHWLAVAKDEESQEAKWRIGFRVVTKK